MAHQLDRSLRRTRVPALAHFAVAELLACQATDPLGPAAPERRRLLNLLCAHPMVGTLARSATEDSVRRLARRCTAAAQAAEMAIPTLPGPLEVLFMRLQAVRLRHALRAVVAMVPWDEVTVRALKEAQDAGQDLDMLDVDRLREIRRALLSGPAGTADVVDSDPLETIRRSAVKWIDLALHSGPTAEARLARESDPAEEVGQNHARARAAPGPVLWAPDVVPEQVTAVGRKAAGLAVMERILGRAAVPGWFVITDPAFRATLAAPLPSAGGATGGTLEDGIRAVLERQDLDPRRQSMAIRELWLRVPLPAFVSEAVTAAYRRLAGEESAPAVAVRSSATLEDSPTATWAGQFDTFLFVAGDEELLYHLRLAWAGLWSPRALDRSARPEGVPFPGGGVVVQRMVDARVAGVAVTVDAVAGDPREMVINAGLGLGEGVVSGAVGADEIHVARTDRAGSALRIRYRVTDKRERVVRSPERRTGTRRVETLFHQRLRPALEYTELESLVEAALRLESGFLEPVDVEFAFEGPALRILQARPIPLIRSALAETVERFPLKEVAS